MKHCPVRGIACLRKEETWLGNLRLISAPGIGSIPGALIGGILLGIIEILGKAYISSQMADAIVFGVLIVVLLVKPSGLLGKQIQEKV